MVKQYELMVLVPASSTPDAIKNFVSKITKLVEAKSGKVLTHESLGRRQMAYQINKQSEAFYLLFTLELDTASTQAVEREIRLTDDIMRSLLLVIDPKAKKVKRTAPAQVESATIEEVTE